MFYSIFLWILILLAGFLGHRGVFFILFLLPITLFTYKNGIYAGLSSAILSVFALFAYTFRAGNMLQHFRVLSLVSLVFLLFPFLIAYVTFQRRETTYDRQEEGLASSEKEPEQGKTKLEEDKFWPRAIELLATAIEQSYLHEGLHIIFNELKDFCSYKTLGIIRRLKKNEQEFEIFYARGLSDSFRIGKKFSPQETEYIEKVLSYAEMRSYPFDIIELEESYDYEEIIKIDENTLLFRQGYEPVERHILKGLASLLRVLIHHFQLKDRLAHSISLAPSVNILSYELFYRKVGEELERLKRYGTYFGLMLMEIENFSKIIKVEGYQSAEHLVETLKEGLSKSVRKVDFITNLEQNKFFILYPNTNLEGLRVAADRVIEKVRELCRATTQLEDIFVNAGVLYVETAIELDNLIYKCHQALQEARVQGPEKVNFKIIS